MAVDFTKPVATADRAQNLTDTKDNMVALAKMLDGLTPTGIANGMIRWSTTNNRFEKYNAGSWGALSSAYAINVTTLNGQAASYYTNIPARLGYTPLDKAGGTMTGALTLNAAPTVDLHASTKKYVDDGLATKSGTSHTHAWAGITNKGLAEGANTQDPNSTQSHVIVTNHANGPDGGAGYWHITTTFYSTLTDSRAQIAVQYAGGAKVYARSYYSGMWQAWVRCDLGDVAKSHGLSGYHKLPGGLILQWGRVAVDTGTYAPVTFPIAFPSMCASVQVSVYAATGTGFDPPRALSVSATGFEAYFSGGGTLSLYWLAAGF